MNALEEVRPGMRVVDASGQEVGSVEDVKMGDADAVTAQGQAGSEGPLERVASAFGGAEPKVPDQQAERMLRLGYIKIDGKGMFSGDQYAAADRVDRVESDTVFLNLDQDQLAER